MKRAILVLAAIALAGCGGAAGSSPTPHEVTNTNPGHSGHETPAPVSTASPPTPQPAISKERAETAMAKYFKEAAAAGAGNVEGEHVICKEPTARGWKCEGYALVPSQHECWIEQVEMLPEANAEGHEREPEAKALGERKLTPQNFAEGARCLP